MSSPEAGQQPPEDDENPGRANVVALIFIVALFAGAYWVFSRLQQHSEIENCVASGRRDCMEIASPDSRGP